MEIGIAHLRQRDSGEKGKVPETTNWFQIYGEGKEQGEAILMDLELPSQHLFGTKLGLEMILFLNILWFNIWVYLKKEKKNVESLPYILGSKMNSNPFLLAAFDPFSSSANRSNIVHLAAKRDIALRNVPLFPGKSLNPYLAVQGAAAVNDFPITVSVNICCMFWQLWNWKCACFTLSRNVVTGQLHHARHPLAPAPFFYLSTALSCNKNCKTRKGW